MKQRAKLPRSGTKKKATNKQAKQSDSPSAETVDRAEEHTKEGTTTKDDAGTSVLGAAAGDASETIATDKTEGEGNGDGSASRGALLQKHKQELRVRICPISSTCVRAVCRGR